MEGVEAIAISAVEGVEPVDQELDAFEPSVEVLFADRYMPLVRLARLLCGSNEAAEDLVQDCFARLLRRRAPIANPVGYVRSSAVNAVRTWQRRKALEHRHPSHVPGQTDDLGFDELQDTLGHLRFRQRAAIVLRFYLDLPEAEIAAVPKCRPGTVKSLVSRGLTRLRDEVGGDD